MSPARSGLGPIVAGALGPGCPPPASAARRTEGGARSPSIGFPSSVDRSVAARVRVRPAAGDVGTRRGSPGRGGPPPGQDPGGGSLLLKLASGL